MFIFFFFFSSRRRHTRYWRDWSSDVCSSDLANQRRHQEQHKHRRDCMANKPSHRCLPIKIEGGTSARLPHFQRHVKVEPTGGTAAKKGTKITTPAFIA